MEKKLAKAIIDIIDIDQDMYPKSFNGVERDAFGDGWNAASIDYFERICEILDKYEISYKECEKICG